MNIVITGATKGIGRALVDAFAREGFDLAVCSRNETDLANLKAEIEEKYDVSVLYKVTDMSDEQNVLDFAEYISSNWNKVDILMNNAGVYFPGDIIDVKGEDMVRMMGTNFYSAFHLTRALLPMMSTQNKGHIFNMCSIASQIALPKGGAYSVSKFALLGFSKSLREELKPKGIRVTAIMPGATWSDSWKAMEGQLPEERLMKASDVAEAVLGAYKLSEQAVVEELVMRPQLGDL